MMKLNTGYMTNMLLVAAAMICMTACAKKKAANEEPRQVLLYTVQAADSDKWTTYPGRTEAAVTANVAFRVSGTLERIYVHEGEGVHRGQVIAKMDDRDYRTQLQATEAEYQQIQADAERVMNLYKDSVTTASNYDKARYGLLQIEQKLRNHRDQVADCVLRAPFDGYVGAVIHEAHETVAAGMPVLTLFADGQTEIVINIPSAEYQRSDEFESFTASFDVLDGERFPLQLLSIAHRANVNQLYEVRLAMQGNHREITPGMSTTVTIHYTPQGTAHTRVPSSALIHGERGDAVLVYSDGRVRLTPVSVATLHSDGTAELASGVTAGQQVVTSGVHQLADGEAVSPYPTPSKTNVGGLL